MFRPVSAIDSLVALQVSLFARGVAGARPAHPGPVEAPGTWPTTAGTGDGNGAGPGGRGNRAAGATPMAGQALATRARREHATQSYLLARRTTLARLESSVREPGDGGLAADLGRYRQAWHEAANNPGHGPASWLVMARAEALTRTVAEYAEAVAAQCVGLRSQAAASVVELNSILDGLAANNAAIVGAAAGSAGLQHRPDGHDGIAMRSAELAGADVSFDVLGRAEVTLDGVVLVAGAAARRIEIADGGDDRGGDDRISIRVSDPRGAGRTGIQVSSGHLGAITDLCNTTLPEFAAELAEVVQLFADCANAQHTSGFDAHGAAGAELFRYDSTAVLDTLATAVTDPTRLATSALPGGLLDGANALRMAAGNLAEDEYQRLVGGLGAQALLAERQEADQRAATNHVDNCRVECSGLSAVDQLSVLRGHQRAYAAAAVVLTSVEAMFDTRIDGGGVQRS